MTSDFHLLTSANGTARNITENHNGRRSLSDRKSDGETYTPVELANFVADQIVTAFQQSANRKPVRVIDPAAGTGNLLVSLVNALVEAEIDIEKVSAFDTNSNALSEAEYRLTSEENSLILDTINADFLQFGLGLDEETSPDNSELFDLLIANPPYIRTQVMGSAKAQALATQFGLTGRVDAYHAFLVTIANVMKPGGIVGIIVSNRFMTTRSGKNVRKSLLRDFDLLHVWDLGDTKVFDAAVLPAVLLLRKKRSGLATARSAYSSIYETVEQADEVADNVIDALSANGVIEVSDGRRFDVRHGELVSRSDSVWSLTTPAIESWLNTIEDHKWGTFGNVGKIRVGVKTCADSVFIKADWDEIPKSQHPELLRPLTTHHDSAAFRAIAARNKKAIVYPHEMSEGKRRAVDLDQYPITKKYLEKNREKLESRSYVIKSGREWFEIWVPQDPSAWDKPKLVMRDISERPTFWLDLDGTVVNGDCYWIVNDSSANEDLLWLAAAVGNSLFAAQYYDIKFNNKLYSGRRRFMTQYVEQFPLPDPSSTAGKELIELAKSLYEMSGTPQGVALMGSLDRMVFSAFGLTGKEVVR